MSDTRIDSSEPALPALVHFGREICGDLAAAERREWWLANGRGAYAAGTVAGTLTRCYHGLLIAPVHPPLGRMLVVAKADTTLLIDGREVPLATNRWTGGAVEPAGHRLIESFRLDGRMPVWRYRVGAACVEMRIWMEWGEDTTYIGFRLEDTKLDAQLRVELLVNARDHHASTAPHAFEPQIVEGDAGLEIVMTHLFKLKINACNGSIQPRHDWYENFDLAAERERGLPDRDSHLRAGEALLDLRPGRWCGLVCSLADSSSNDLEAAMKRAFDHDRAQLQRASAKVSEMADAPAWIRQLLLAADNFIFARPLVDAPDGESVIAGYPWFGDWGRDTMIALPGLTLATGRHESARRILGTFARFIDRGMLPNVFSGTGETAEYNTVDAALWYIEAWRAYVETTNDLASLKTSWPVLQGIIEHYRDGTRYGIHVDDADGLLRAGEPGVQLTWMDAKVGDWVVTPRIGKPVEINALWYNALVAMSGLAARLGESGDAYRTQGERTREGFKRFHDAETGGLLDVLDGPAGNETSARPNQIFAVSLPASPIDADTQRRIVELCGHKLFTSHGLRSLSPDDPAYRGVYAGGVRERDGAYHQGPVWAWLLGHYALAELRVTGDAEAAQKRLEALADHLLDAGLGTVSEILDGDAPHMPRGTPSQAWSVACTLEAWWRLERARRLHETAAG